jgi:hypothetical protein
MLLSKLNLHSSPYSGLEVHMKNAIIANIHDI